MHKYRILIGVAKGLDLSKAKSIIGGVSSSISSRSSSSSIKQSSKAGLLSLEKNSILQRRFQENKTSTSSNRIHKEGSVASLSSYSITMTNLPSYDGTTALSSSYSYSALKKSDAMTTTPPSLWSSSSSSLSSLWNNNKSTASFHSNSVNTSRKAHAGIGVGSTRSVVTSPFPKWPADMIESTGNYKVDADILEPIIGGPLYSAQATLPRLPIPDLKDTISTFLPTALPLADTEQEAKDLLHKCRVFPQQALPLHQKLLHRKEHDMKDTSWLQLWWNTAGYLQVRDPVTINVSYYFNFKDDPTINMAGAVDGEARTHQQNDRLGVKRGAALLHASAEFRKLICSGQFPHERIGKKEPKTPLCSVAFKYMFHSCRIPRREMDTYRMYDPSLHTHCIVARNGRFFAVDFVDESGNPLGVDVLEQRLERCIQLADADDHTSGIPMLGWLTSSDRDSWADAREELLNIGGKAMERALEKLESGALLLCLDSENPVSKKECGDLFWTGNLSSGHNRWFDKSIQLFVTDNGKAGLQGEHSMMDGMPVIAFSDYITKQSYSSASKKSASPRENYGANDGIIDIFSECKSQLTSSNNFRLISMIDKAKNDFQTLVTDHEQIVQSFQGYGSNAMKKMGYSPDAYAQMAIQLAVYRLHGKQVGTYEASQMRPYLHGRTETTRAVSMESAAFVRRMGRMANFNDSSSSLEEKKSLLVKAVRSHVEYLGKAASGKGVDRHFLGLSMIADKSDVLPELYSDPVFIRSKTWRVSTSHLTHPNIEHWGFGEVVPDGLGVAYSIKPDSCIFNIAARKEHGWTEKFSHLLEEALLEMRALNEPALTSKL